MIENEAIGGKGNVQIVIVEEKGRVVGSTSMSPHFHHDAANG